MWIKLTSYIKIIDVGPKNPRFSVSYIRGKSRLYKKYVYVASSNLNFALDIRKFTIVGDHFYMCYEVWHKNILVSP